MLSPTLALRCPHCQHALALADIRDASVCPACDQAHGLPPAVADALALYERAIQQAVSDLVRSAPASPGSLDGPAQPAPLEPRTHAPHEPGPSARLLAAPVHPTTLLSIGPAPVPPVGARPVRRGPAAGPPPVPRNTSAVPPPVPRDTSAPPAVGRDTAAPAGTSSVARLPAADSPPVPGDTSVAAAASPVLGATSVPAAASPVLGATSVPAASPVLGTTSVPAAASPVLGATSVPAAASPVLGTTSVAAAASPVPAAPSVPAATSVPAAASPVPGATSVAVAASPVPGDPSVAAGETLRAPVPSASISPAALSGALAVARPGADPQGAEPLAADEPAQLSLPVDLPARSESPPGPVPADSPALTGPAPARPQPPVSRASRAGDPHLPAGLGDLVPPGDTVPGAAVPPSNSSLLSIVYGRSGTSLSSPASGEGLAQPPGGLAEAPLQVAAVREPVDRQPARSASDLIDAVRSFLPDRPDAEPEREGRIPAAALAVARRALLVRHADERRRQQVRDGSLGLLFAAVVCIILVGAGLWYIAAPIALLAVILRLRREERGERFGAEVQRLGDALGGQRLPSYDAIAAWFDGLWPAPVSPEAMWTSHLHGAVRCDVHGYAALVDVHLNEKTAGGVVYPPRITAYLAAIWPGRVPSLRPSATDLSPAAHARLTRLRKAGYTVVADPHGGLIMRASEAIAQAARADITRLPALQVPIGELADLARDLGAEPVAVP